LTLLYGERLEGARDKYSQNIAAVLGVPANSLREVTLEGPAPNAAVKILQRLRDSEYLVPQEGYKFLALGTGPVGSPSPSGTEPLSGRTFSDPLPRYMGERPVPKEELRARRRVYDLHQVVLELTVPPKAKSLSFDFNFFSAEYPDYIGADFNDTFYAVLEAPSTNNGEPTNISFDSDGNSIEVDNNYFQNPFHPIPNFGTGFDLHGSTGWLRTSWPVDPGENITLTFSVHDEGDGIYDSLVILDNVQWHDYEAVGTTDPLN
jgi:hypothetical protein